MSHSDALTRVTESPLLPPPPTYMSGRAVSSLDPSIGYVPGGSPSASADPPGEITEAIPNATGARAPSARKPKRARIAVLEDDPLVRELIQDALGERGYEIVSFGDLASATKALAGTPPDLLVSDVELPDGSGLELVRTLRKRYPNLPVLVQSGRVGEGDLLEGFEAGASDYITKPISLAELAAKCTVLLARGKAAFEASSQPNFDLPGGLKRAFGRYRIDRLLGSGGEGSVYAAWDLDEGQEVALKVLPALAGLREDQRLRFVRETYALSLVQSVHVTRVLDFGTLEGRPYYTMELIDGTSLQELITERGPASEAQVLVLLKTLAQALVSVHAAGLIHRDIKPGNVVLRHDSYAEPVLVDFGLAKQPGDHTVTKTGVLVGTPAYLSPERVRGEPLDGRSDLFSLGLLALFACTGRPCYSEGSLLELLHDVASRPVPLPRELSPGLREVLGRLTQLQPSARYASATALLEALRAAGH
ncbi:MAG: response regulator [Planctomycetes bacterium]|nr:response regulator [Planctomycetota bacterium]